MSKTAQMKHRFDKSLDAPASISSRTGERDEGDSLGSLIEDRGRNPLDVLTDEEDEHAARVFRRGFGLFLKKIYSKNERAFLKLLMSGMKPQEIGARYRVKWFDYMQALQKKAYKNADIFAEIVRLSGWSHAQEFGGIVLKRLSSLNEGADVNEILPQNRKIKEGREKRRSRYEAHREEILAINKAYREAHREEMQAKERAYYNEHREEMQAYREAHREEIRENMRAYYNKHREEIKKRDRARDKARYEARREEMQAYREVHREELREYREAHREELQAKKRAYYNEHREEIQAKKKAYREAHREELQAKKRAYKARKKAEKLLKQAERQDTRAEGARLTTSAEYAGAENVGEYAAIRAGETLAGLSAATGE